MGIMNYEFVIQCNEKNVWLKMDEAGDWLYRSEFQLSQLEFCRFNQKMILPFSTRIPINPIRYFPQRD